MSLVIILYHSPDCGYCQQIKAKGSGGWPKMQNNPRLKGSDFEEVNVRNLASQPAFLQGRGVPQIHLVRRGGQSTDDTSLHSHLGSFSAANDEPVVDKFVKAIADAAPEARRRARQRRAAVNG
jgi:hypothetical protein